MSGSHIKPKKARRRLAARKRAWHLAREACIRNNPARAGSYAKEPGSLHR